MLKDFYVKMDNIAAFIEGVKEWLAVFFLEANNLVVVGILGFLALILLVGIVVFIKKAKFIFIVLLVAVVAFTLGWYFFGRNTGSEQVSNLILNRLF